MRQAPINTMETAGAPDWSRLPEDLLLAAMEAMEVHDVVCLGAVCTSWRSAYATFRHLRLPSPKQPPCLLYACDAYGPGAAALYSPSTNATFRVPLPEPPLPLRDLAGSAHGWLFTNDEAVNPYLLNPLTGARALLPPITTIRRVESSFSDEQGSLFYNIDFKSGEPPHLVPIPVHEMRGWMYRRVALSAGGAASACVVLLVHGPGCELSFARPGDERWTSLSGLKALECEAFFSSVVYNDNDGMFYVLDIGGAVYSLDLNGPSPSARKIICATTTTKCLAKSTGYLVFTPCGDLLLVFRSWDESVKTPARDDTSFREDLDSVDESYWNRHREATTTHFHLYKVDVNKQRLVKLPGLGDHALFLGRNSVMCLPIEDFPTLLPNRAYLADNCDLFTPMKRPDLGIWDFGSGSLQKLSDLWPLHPRLDKPIPIWITPSLC